MGDDNREQMEQGRTALKLLQLHHRQQREIARLKRRLADQTRQQVEKLTGGLPGEMSAAPAGDRPALEVATELMREVPNALREAIIRKLPPELQEEVLEALFSFHALPMLAPRDVQAIVRKADKRTLAISLLGAPEEYFHAVTGNMSRRAGEMLREDMESLLASGDLKTRDVHEARSALSSLVREVARHESETDEHTES